MILGRYGGRKTKVIKYFKRFGLASKNLLVILFSLLELHTSILKNKIKFSRFERFVFKNEINQICKPLQKLAGLLKKSVRRKGAQTSKQPKIFLFLLYKSQISEKVWQLRLKEVFKIKSMLVTTDFFSFSKSTEGIFQAWLIRIFSMIILYKYYCCMIIQCF